ncbi:hypothetical protein GWC95_15830 [Sediminibacterium roseum]|uniref:Uncharacterized protein n=1 Tax=Sediminibacterium roseum TaxID=1978412 RepID=A0ABW9ZWK5_9BACT|nr:DUF6650 family protein [Sediminibacterium roseum]NCI51399.1 hypothetical protein [Sediminibacterium roseum]
MTFKEIANKITGISFPVFGVSWTPTKPEIEIARKVIAFLEDRRVLYVVYQLETPQHCVDSVLKIREFLTTTLFEINADSELSDVLKAMRSACRTFLNEVQNAHYSKDSKRLELNQLGLGGEIHFFNAMGVLRALTGVLIAKVLVMHGIDCESELLSIIPFTEDDS